MHVKYNPGNDDRFMIASMKMGAVQMSYDGLKGGGGSKTLDYTQKDGLLHQNTVIYGEGD